jgi:nitroimidazol reductase NimA-like FMN-containing flavoprotein (pyridoxamine 5'-phosphate oxidase superfamily)
MPSPQGALKLLAEPAAQELLHSTIPARLAYLGHDGAPRVIPIWFHWNGREIILGSPPNAPKVRALSRHPRVALTIDTNTFPHRVLQIRGTARIKIDLLR